MFQKSLNVTLNKLVFQGCFKGVYGIFKEVVVM